ncbi:MbcA/ParS/Xre antitoxin family protein [Facilibium subflavum]|uniref:MbcA/ParS/Xre antitoxin family protein n=1 Tax=Facilibium subflavum TaxID=2219058 RepID=UPI000E64B7B6|nr:MbcA/ParS/Xre antitoxin family protein [Facilibium subflavum]
MTALSIANDSAIIAKSLENASKLYGISQADIAKVLHMSNSAFSKAKNQNSNSFSPDTITGELALYFIKIIRSLDAIYGGNEEICKKWLTNNNNDFDGKKPLELMRSVKGLVFIMNYLDYYRGRV